MSKAKAKRYPFTPDYAVPPGATLLETIQFQGMTRETLARIVGVSFGVIDAVIAGRIPIRRHIANGLERATGIRAWMWLKLETDYRQRLAKLEAGDG